MDFSKLIDKFQNIMGLLIQDAPNALEWTKEILSQIQSAIGYAEKEFATIEKVVMGAEVKVKGGAKRMTHHRVEEAKADFSGQVAALRSLHEEFRTLASRNPGLVQMRRTEMKLKADASPHLEVSLSLLVAEIVKALLSRIEALHPAAAQNAP